MREEPFGTSTLCPLTLLWGRYCEGEARSSVYAGGFQHGIYGFLLLASPLPARLNRLGRGTRDAADEAGATGRDVVVAERDTQVLRA